MSLCSLKFKAAEDQYFPSNSFSQFLTFFSQDGEEHVVCTLDNNTNAAE